MNKQWCSLLAISQITQSIHTSNEWLMNVLCKTFLMFLMNETVLDDFASSGLFLSPLVKIHTKQNDRGLNRGFVFVYAPQSLRHTATPDILKQPEHTSISKNNNNRKNKYSFWFCILNTIWNIYFHIKIRKNFLKCFVFSDFFHYIWNIFCLHSISFQIIYLFLFF